MLPNVPRTITSWLPRRLPKELKLPGVNALLYEVLACGHLRRDAPGRGDVVRRYGVADLHQDAGALYVVDVRGVGVEVLEEARLLDVGRVRVPLVEVARGHVHPVPLLVAGVDVGVLLAVDVRVEGVLDLAGDLLLRGPHVLQVDRVSVPVLPERVPGEVDVHRAGQRVGDHERRRGQVVGPDVGVDAPLEVPVARENGGHDEVVLLDGRGDLLGQRPRVADARRAAVADHVEAELLQRVEQARGLEVLGDDLRAWRQAGLYVRLDHEALLDRLFGEQPRAHHHRRVARVGAGRDRRYDRRAVLEVHLLAVDRDGDGA
jgi:hypothetical protein